MGRIFSRILLSVALAGVSACGQPEVIAPPGSPNILLIIADDLNWRDLGVTGNPDVKTPHIDELAREGMQLRGMFSPAPTCSPARHSLYTGLFPVRSGGFPNHSVLYKGTKSVFTYLKDGGYRVGLLGKVHVHPRSSYPFKHLGDDPDDMRALQGFLARDTKRPWFLVFASKDPHGPWDRGSHDSYEPERLSVPPYLHDTEVTRRNLAAYYSEVSKLDEQVGAVLGILASSGQDKRTLVMFVSEQGSSLPYGGKSSLYDNGIRTATFVRWPGRVAAGSHSDALLQYVDVTPTFLEIAGIDPAAIDTGCPDASANRGFDGKSFLNVLSGTSDRGREYVFAQHTTLGQEGKNRPYPIRAVRDARYKLIRNLAWQEARELPSNDILDSWRRDATGDPRLADRIRHLSHRPAEELYDLTQDPFEINNLAELPDYAATRARLGKQLDDWMRQQGDRGLETEMEAPSRQR